MEDRGLGGEQAFGSSDGPMFELLGSGEVATLFPTCAAGEVSRKKTSFTGGLFVKVALG